MFHRIKIVTGIAAAILMFLLMMLTVVDVIGRNFLHSPLPGAAELTEMVLPLVVFLLLPQIALEQKHITVELIDSISGPVLKWLQSACAAIAGTALFGLIAWQIWILGDRAASYGDVSTTLHIPLAPILHVIAILAGISAVATAVTFFMPQRNHVSEAVAVEDAKRSAV